MSNATFWRKAESRQGGVEQLKTDVEKLKVNIFKIFKHFQVFQNFSIFSPYKNVLYQILGIQN